MRKVEVIMLEHGFWDEHVAVGAFYRWQSEQCPTGRDKDHWRLTVDELTSRWKREFPRFAELHTDMPDIIAYEGWFAGLPSKVYATPISLEFYAYRESELASISDNAWQKLKSKVVNNRNGQRAQLIRFLNEAAGYSYLQETLLGRAIPFDDIDEPLVRGLKPEWQASHKGRVVAALEVKTVKFPNDAEPSTGKVDPTIEQKKLQSKLIRNNINKAKKQLRALESGKDIIRIAYIIVNVNYEQSQWHENKDEIASFLHLRSDADVKIIPDIRMWPHNT